MKKLLRSRWFLIGIGTLTLITALFFFQQGQRSAAAQEPQTGDIVTAFIGDLSASATASGNIEAEQTAALALLRGGTVAEIKRLWVSPAARGLKLATRLMTRTEQIARDLGITTLRLDTNSALPEAAALYRNTGWSEIARFNDDPYPDMFFEKNL